MNWIHYGVFLATAFVVAAAPGPTVLQIFSQALSGDARRPASLIVGSVTANALMVAASVLGIGVVIVASQTVFTTLKWVGAGYLIWLGVHYWMMPAGSLASARPARRVPYRALFIQAILTSLTNPKGLAFYAAFLPQFVTPRGDPASQLAILGASYVGLCLLVDIGYAFAGMAVSGLTLSARAVRLKNRITGSALIGAGLSLLRERPA